MLEGEINQINLVERLVELWREQFTGAIRFESEGIIKILYFKGGDILSASTNDRSDSIDEILMRAGKVSREHVKQALAKRKENETLGDALLNLGFITRKELTWARRIQVVGVIRSIAAWTEGSFTIVADYLPKRDEGTLFPLPQVILELAVTDQDRARYERELEGGNSVFTKTADFDTTWRTLGLNDEAEAIAGEIDGTKSANEIAVASGGETFNVYKLLYGLSLLGLVRRAPKAQESPELSLDDFASAGVADAADLWSTPAATPSFELDTDLGVSHDFRTEQPVVSGSSQFSFDEPPAAPAAHEPQFMTEPDEPYQFDETPDQEPAPVPVAPVPPPSQLPAWDAPPRQPLAVPIPGAIEPPVDADEELGGFDEAQLETARRATVPPSAAVPPLASASRSPLTRKRPKSRTGLWIALLALLVVGVGGYFGAQWWMGRQEPETVVASPTPTPATPAATPSETGTIVPLTTAPAVTATEVGGDPTATAPLTATVVPGATIAEMPAATSTTVATATVAPAPVAPAPVASTPTAPPTDNSPAKARLDAMAQRFAANPSGNFTVQIQILCNAGNLENAMRVGGDAVWFVPQSINGRSCYRVFWGRFETQADAQRAMAQIPASLRDRSAAVKPVPGR